MNPRPPRRGPAAFSLVEVTLSLGIIGFALVAVLGLLGVGINASRDNADDTVMGLIVQDLGNRVRSELASVGPPTDASGGALTLDGSDFRWNPAFGTRPGYAAASTLAASSGPTANAYYTREGVFVREAVSGAEKANYYKAAVAVAHLTDTAYQNMNLLPPNAAASGDYPLLAVTVNVGWPAQPTKDGAVVGPTANQARTTFTFFLSKP